MERYTQPNEHTEHSAAARVAAKMAVQRMVEQHQLQQVADPRNPHESTGFGD